MKPWFGASGYKYWEPVTEAILEDCGREPLDGAELPEHIGLAGFHCPVRGIPLGQMETGMGIWQHPNSIYGPRSRDENIGLIRALRAARDEQAFLAASRAASASMHPSLLSELDWMEITMPEAQREAGGRFVDGFFAHHLRDIFAVRSAAFEQPDEVLEQDVAENMGFYRTAADDPSRPLDGLGEALALRIRNIIDRTRSAPDDALTRRRGPMQAAAADLISSSTDGAWVALRMLATLENQLLLTLAHPPTRPRAKHWLRSVGGSLPVAALDDFVSEDGITHAMTHLEGMARSTERAALYDLAALCDALAAALGAAAAGGFPGYEGQLGLGKGSCRRCAMHFTSTTVAVTRAGAPATGRGGRDTITVPIDFNLATCVFCGEEARVDAPALFHAVERDLVIYNMPRLGQWSEEEARAVHHEFLVRVRDDYVSRLDDGERQRFAMAREEVTFNIVDFLRCIQMGTTVREEHVWNLVRFADGTGLTVDPTKGVIIPLTKGEIDEQWTSQPAFGTDVSAGIVAGNPLQESLSAFEAGDFARARDLLAPIYQGNPADRVCRQNLATALYKLGDMAGARRVLAGDPTWMP